MRVEKNNLPFGVRKREAVFAVMLREKEQNLPTSLKKQPAWTLLFCHYTSVYFPHYIK